MQPSIDHPACSGVVMEVRSEFWCDNPDSPDQPHFEAARYVAASGKRLFIMPPPRDHQTKPLPGQMSCMLDALYGALGKGFFCSGGFHIVASAYGYGPLALLPDRTSDGEIAPTFMGAVLEMREKRMELCGSGGDDDDVSSGEAEPEVMPDPEPVPEPEPEVVEPEVMPEPMPEPVPEPEVLPEPVPEPVPEPEMEDDDDDDDDMPAAPPQRKGGKAPRVHSSSMTSAEMVASIRKQRKAGANAKVPVRTPPSAAAAASAACFARPRMLRRRASRHVVRTRRACATATRLHTTA